jgi:hypothetical protein
MSEIEEVDFPLAHELRLIALQGDWGLRVDTTATGGVYVVDQPERARQVCLDLVQQAQSVNAHLALIPELTIPKTAISELVDAVQASPQPLVLIGGVEGLTLDEYRSLATQYGSPLDVPVGTPGTYVNAMIVVARTLSGVKVYWRAKRIPSGPENSGGPQMANGAGPFISLKLGPTPFVIVPLVCSELVWPELWAKVSQEVPNVPIDLMPVLQRNDDVERRHIGPVVHSAYQNNGQMRFVLANQALLPESDGTCYVFVPPASPSSPGFDHGRNELWLPDSCTYKGFRIPERLGCFWSAQIIHRSGPMNATRPPVCAGRVVSVLRPENVDLAGLSAGLMRSAASRHHAVSRQVSSEPTEVRIAFQQSLSQSQTTYILRDATRATASQSFFHMICDDRPTWTNVEAIVDDFVEVAGLLACGGDEVRLGSFSGGNCSVSGRPVAVLFAPTVDVALAARFSTSTLLSGSELPGGIVLLQVKESSSSPRARTVGDVLRADRVSSESPELSDGPTRVPDNAVTIRLGDIHFCELKDLRPGLQESTAIAARSRAAALLPGVFA